VLGFTFTLPNMYVFLVLILTLVKYHVEFHKVQYLDPCYFYCTLMTLVSISCSTVKLFADDINLFIYGKSAEDQQVAAMHEIILLSEWFIANKLSLIINKSCYTVSGASSEEKSRINLNISNTVHQQVEFSKYLGVYIDSDLSWQHYIDFIYDKKLIRR